MKSKLNVIVMESKFFLLIIGLLLFVGCKDDDNNNEPTQRYRGLTEILATDQFGVAFRNNDIALGLEVQRIMDEMIEDGTAEAISRKWFDENILLKNQPFLKESTAPAGDNSLQNIKNKGEIIFGALIDPPLFIMQKGTFSGFDAEIAQEVAKRMGINIVFKPIISWDDKTILLNNGEIDCIWGGYSITPSRLDSVFIAKGYSNNRVCVLVNGNSQIEKISQLEGKNVGLLVGSSHIDDLQSHSVYPKIKNTILANSTEELFMLLDAGAIDAFVIDEIVALFFRKQFGMNNNGKVIAPIKLP